MEFNEKKSKEIAEKFGVAPATITTWRNRGSIPDKYSGGLLIVISQTELKEFDKIIKAFSYNKLNRSAIAEGSKLDVARLSDLLREKAKPHMHEFTAIKKSVNEVRNEVKNFLTEVNKTRQISSIAEKKFKGIIEDRRIVLFKVIDQNREFFAKIDGYKRGARTTFPSEIVDQLKTHFLVFLTETTIA